MALYVPPSLVLSLTIAAFYGGLFHLLCGRVAVDLPRAMGIAIAGFLAGDAGARLVTESSGLMVGDIHVGVASVVAWAGLAINHWRIWEL